MKSLAERALPYADANEWLPQHLMHHAEFKVERPFLVVEFTDGSRLETREGIDTPWVVKPPAELTPKDTNERK